MVCRIIWNTFDQLSIIWCSPLPKQNILISAAHHSMPTVQSWPLKKGCTFLPLSFQTFLEAKKLWHFFKKKTKFSFFSLDIGNNKNDKKIFTLMPSNCFTSFFALPPTSVIPKWVRLPRTGEMVKNGIFFTFLKLYCDQTVWVFQLFSTVLKRFCPLDSKN